MEDHTIATSGSPELPDPSSFETGELSAAEERAKRVLIIGAVVVLLLVVGLIVLLVMLSVDAYGATMRHEGPTAGQVVVSLIRDAAIVFVAFETLLIGILLIVIMVQMNSLITLLRGEIQPMLEAINETLATVRGTTQFVSHNIVSPVVKWSGYLAGLQRVLREIAGLKEIGKSEE